MATLKDTIINGNLTVNGDIKGGDSAHNNMPPYYTANIWRRIS